MQAQICQLQSETAGLRIAGSRLGTFKPPADGAHQHADDLRRCNARLSASLHFYMGNLPGGEDGQLAKSMLVAFFVERPTLLHHLLAELDVHTRLEMETVEAIQERWTFDICAAMFVHGELTYAGYQALINIMSRTYCVEVDTSEPISLPHGPTMPRLKSKYKLHHHLLEIVTFVRRQGCCSPHRLRQHQD